MKASAILVLAGLTGCANVQQVIGGYQAAAAVSLRAAEDNAIAVWTFTGCATPYSAALRNPQIIPALQTLCGRSVLFAATPEPAAASIQPPPSDQAVPK